MSFSQDMYFNLSGSKLTNSNWNLEKGGGARIVITGVPM